VGSWFTQWQDADHLELWTRESTVGRRMKVLTVIPVVAVALVAGGCVESTNTTVSTGGVTLVKAGQLTTCSHLDYVPFQYSDNGKVVGFDVDLVDLVAKELGTTQQVVNTQFDVIKTGAVLNTNQCDVVAGAISITDVRKQNIDFSESYFRGTQAVLTKKGNNHTSLAALAGKKLGVQNGTTGKDFADKYNAAHGNSITEVNFENLALAETAVKTGQVDAAINDNGPLLDYARKNPDTDVTAEFDTNDQYGFGVKKGNTALLDKINQAITASVKSGDYTKIYQKWFGKAPTWQPGDPTPTTTAQG
jgi:polar amino acid transport system substrate-binding protein